MLYRRERFGVPMMLSANSRWTYLMLHDAIKAQTQRFMKDTFIKNAFMKALTAQSMTLPYTAKVTNPSGTACGTCGREGCTGCALPMDDTKLKLKAQAANYNAKRIYIALDWADPVNDYDDEYEATMLSK